MLSLAFSSSRSPKSCVRRSEVSSSSACERVRASDSSLSERSLLSASRRSASVVRLAHDPLGLGPRLADELVGVAGGDLQQPDGGAGGLRDGGDLEGLLRRGGRRLGRGARSRRSVLRRLLLGGGLVGGPVGGLGRRRPAVGGPELAAQLVVLAGQPGQLGLDLVEELVDLAHVVALAEPDGRKALVAHVLGVSGMNSPFVCSRRWGRTVRGPGTGEDTHPARAPGNRPEAAGGLRTAAGRRGCAAGRRPPARSGSWCRASPRRAAAAARTAGRT